MEAEDPVGPHNDAILREQYILPRRTLRSSGVLRPDNMVIACWGTKGNFMERDLQVRRIITRMYHLGLTKAGHPRHPLYLKKTIQPTLWEKKEIE